MKTLKHQNIRLQAWSKRLILLFLVSVSFLSTSFLGGDDPVDKLRIKTIVIDAGHGGKDPGNMGTGRFQVSEKHVSLDVALKLGAYIEENFPEVKVIYTRKTDVFIELKKRTEIANEADADLFISIHCNSHTTSSASGTETFVMGMHKNEANLQLAQKENSVMLLEDNHEADYSGFDPNDPEAYIIFSVLQSAYMEQSKSLSAKVQEQFRERVNRKDRGVKQAGFWVISYTTMPSILVELGFLSNYDEEDFLVSEQGKDYMASAIFRAFKSYKQEVEAVNSAIVTGGEDNTEQDHVKEIELAETPKPNSPKENEPKKLNPKPAVEKEVPKTSPKPKVVTTDVPDPKIKVAERFDPLAGKKYVPNKAGIVFKVQLATTSKPITLRPENFNGIMGVELSKNKGVYKYMVGKESTLDGAKNLQDAVRKFGFSGAFIVAFQNEIRIDLKKALSLLAK